MENRRYTIRDVKTGAEIKKRDQHYYDRVNQYPEYSSYLETIDFKLLDSIIEKTLAHCGIENDDRLSIDLDSLFVNRSSGRAYYDPAMDEIGFNKDFLNQPGSPKEKMLNVLPILVHEYLHKLSYIRIDINNGPRRPNRERVGLSEKDYFRNFNSLDEGVNEMLSRKIVTEYLIAAGNHKLADQIENSREVEGAYPNYNLRSSEVEMVDQLILLIAEKTEISPETIFQAMVREKFTGENQPSEIWENLLIELLGEQEGYDLYLKLRNASDNNPLALSLGEEVKRIRSKSA